MGAGTLAPGGGVHGSGLGAGVSGPMATGSRLTAPAGRLTGLGRGLTGTGSRGGGHGASFHSVKKSIKAREPIEQINKGSGWGVKYNEKPGSMAGLRLGQLIGLQEKPEKQRASKPSAENKSNEPIHAQASTGWAALRLSAKRSMIDRYLIRSAVPSGSRVTCKLSEPLPHRPTISQPSPI